MPNFCPTCGSELQFKEAEICPKCGVRIKAPPQPERDTYAGFWTRFVAKIIDSVICAMVIYAVLFAFLLLGIASASKNYLYSSNYFASMGIFFILWFIFAVGFIWLYFAVQESSSAQATLGKRAVKIIVTDSKGNRVSFGTATVRTIIKCIPVLGFISCLVIGFSENKQGLHDMVANTYVRFSDS